MIEIFHVSDLHFGKQTRKASFLLEELGKKFQIGQQENRFLLITGDIVQHGWKKQYERAKKALIPFKGKVYAVPGNHDYGFMGFVYSKRSAKNFDDILSSGLKIDHRYFPKKLYSKVLKDKEGNRVMLIGLNSCSMTKQWLDIAEGDIGDHQRTKLEQILSDPADKDIPKIVYLHHIPHRRAQGVGMSLRDYKKLMGVLGNRVHVLAFGHEGALEDVTEEEIKKKKISGQEYQMLMNIKKTANQGRDLKLRSNRAYGIRYYLDANRSVDDLSCYRIKIDGNQVSARRTKLSPRSS